MAIDAQMPASSSSARWCACVSDVAWKPTPEQYQFLLSQQPAEERERIGKFVKQEDSKRSLMGRIMLQNAAAMALNMEPSHVQFGRTKGRKPYIHEPAAALRGLNANVSHHGSWVVLGMEDKGLVGVDVSANKPPRQMKAEPFFKSMTTALTKNEWAAVRAAGSSDEEQLHAFFMFWSLKEAYTKAIGIGLALPFKRLELAVPEHILKSFHNVVSQPQRFAGDSAIQVFLDGRLKPDWEFEMYALDQEHVMAVAVGPFELAVASYKAAMEELTAAAAQPGKKVSGRRLSAGNIRKSLLETGNDRPADLSISACAADIAISDGQSLCRLSVVRPETLLPPSLAAQYQQA